MSEHKAYCWIDTGRGLKLVDQRGFAVLFDFPPMGLPVFSRKEFNRRAFARMKAANEHKLSKQAFAKLQASAIYRLFEEAARP